MGEYENWRIGKLESRTKDSGQRTTDKGQRTNDNGQRTTDNGQKTKDKGQRTTTDHGRRTTDNGPRTKDNGQRTKDQKLNAKNWKSHRLISLAYSTGSSYWLMGKLKNAKWKPKTESQKLKIPQDHSTVSSHWITPLAHPTGSWESWKPKTEKQKLKTNN